MRLGSLFAWIGAGVLSVAKLTLGQEAYYEQQVARGLDDYYAGRGESPGMWAGSGTKRLGLVGVVEDGDLGTLLRGVNPASQEVLRAPVRERMITLRTLDVESGEWRVASVDVLLNRRLRNPTSLAFWSAWPYSAILRGKLAL